MIGTLLFLLACVNVANLLLACGVAAAAKPIRPAGAVNASSLSRFVTLDMTNLGLPHRGGGSCGGGTLHHSSLEFGERAGFRHVFGRGFNPPARDGSESISTTAPLSPLDRDKS